MTPTYTRLLLATALTCVGSIALTVALWTAEPAQAPLLVAVAALVLIVLLLLRPAREDLDAVLIWVGVLSLGGALVVGVYFLYAYRPGENPKRAAAVAAVLGTVALAWTFKRQSSPEDPDLPNVLGAVQGLGPVRESNGVQFGAVVQAGSESRPHRIEVYFQNCGTAPRTAGFAFHGPLTRVVRAPGPAKVEIGPAEVRRLTLPVVTSDREGPNTVDVLIGIAGEGGRRIRLRRARRALPHSKLDPVGYLRVHLDPQPAVLWELPLPAPQNELVWAPRAGTWEGVSSA